MQYLNIGVKIPINAATKTFAWLAKRGAGKTYAASTLAEEFHKVGVPFVVFDPIDVWWGLRLSADGKSKGLPIVVFGKEHADIQLTRDMGREIARAVVKENISCVISTFGMSKTDMRFLIAEFAEELLNINNTPRHVFIEEAHEYVPQRVQPGTGRTFAAVEALVVMGRNRGIGVSLINQRAATVNKDVLTQLDTLIALQNTSPQDRAALQGWVEVHNEDEAKFDKFMKSLPSLPKGEGWIWSPEFMRVFEKIKIRKRDTFHPDREKIGDKFVMPQLDAIDVQTFIGKFKAQIETPKMKVTEKMVKEMKAAKFEIKVNPLASAPSIVVPMSERVHEDLRIANEEIRRITNSYESQLIEKDVEIRGLRAIIAKVQSAVSVQTATSPMSSGEGSRGDIDAWLEKLGRNRAEGKVLSFLDSQRGLSFTKPQIAIRCQLSARSGGFNQSVNNLVKWKLIVKSGDEFAVSPDL